MAYELFISPNRLKRDTALSESVDDDLISPYVWVAQQQYILPVLGEKLYNKIATDISAGSVTGDYETLLETYIQPTLTHYAFATLIPFLRVRFVNNAVVVMSSEQSDAASDQEIKPVLNKTEAIAAFLRERLVDYLTNKSDLFPEYNTNEEHQLQPTTRNYTQGLNLDPAWYDLDTKAFLEAIRAKKFY